MDRDLLAGALLRIQVARYRKNPNFAAEVDAAFKEAISQPFGTPLYVAGVHSQSQSPSRRAIWSAVVERLQADPQGGSREMPVRIVQPEQPPPSADCLQCRVTIDTDVGPDSPGGRLAALAKEGAATVQLRQDPDGTPWLLYLVDRDRAPDQLAALIEPEMLHAAE